MAKKKVEYKLHQITVIKNKDLPGDVVGALYKYKNIKVRLGYIGEKESKLEVVEI